MAREIISTSVANPARLIDLKGAMVAVDAQRRNAIVSAMNAAGLEALASFAPAEVLLLSGYWPVMGTSIAMLTRGGVLTVLLPEDEVELAKATSDAHLIPYQTETLDELTPLSEALMQPGYELASYIRIDAGTIGTNLKDGSEGVSYQSANRFRSLASGFLHRTYPRANVVSAGEILERLMSVRTPIEVDQLRHAGALASTGFRAAEQNVAVGRSEVEIAVEAEATFGRTANDGFERGRGYFFCMSGPNSAKAAGAYARTRVRRLQEGDFVMIHANTVGDGTWTDITRTYVVGHASEQQTRMLDAVREARDMALQAVTPGAKASAVDAAARNVLTRHGFGSAFSHGVGHGVGFAATDANAIPRLHPKSSDVLEAGMTFNIEPAVYIHGFGGVRHCDVVACTESGAEVLTPF